ncbi:alpha/beta hydrolase [Rhodoferax koreense]|uniref:Alpha/beta hydrolase n=2 Tax=Rhodoferax koreensis TaxID=1842727 RepID=A0A1P8JWI0_9BURK|nr:alpha/beta hydrolase [Rhodoferax koreense]
MNAVRILMVPGWRNSGPGHWQSLWTDRLAAVERVEQDNWVVPSKDAWVGTLARAILASPAPVVVVAHSLGCIATTHLPPEAANRIQGALLVAPADPERRSVLSDFAPVPYQKLPYRSVLVASSNDPYCPVRLAGAYARAWGSEFVRLQDAGHINVESGFGEWPLGLALLQSLAGTDAPLPLRAQDATLGENPPSSFSQSAETA